jgi:hypothetical protein
MGHLMFKIQGLDKLQRQLDDLSRRAAALNGTHSVPVAQMLTPAFMQKHTGFRDIDTFFGAGGFSVESTADLEAIAEADLDAWVLKNSKFTTWKQMLDAAGSQWAAGKLGLR